MSGIETLWRRYGESPAFAGMPGCEEHATPGLWINPEDLEQIRALRKAFDQYSAEPGYPSGWQVALRSLITPAPVRRPVEPTGWGAVVEDIDGKRWVHAGDRKPDGRSWWLSGDEPERWRDIAAVRVLSEGVPND